MIVSASRRTDIPALFSEWFYNRVGKGFVLLKNPYNPLQVGRVTLTPDKVDGFVFWTKNAAPMLPRIHELDAFKYYFQFTITPYGRDVEKNIPDKKEVVISYAAMYDAEEVMKKAVKDLYNNKKDISVYGVVNNCQRLLVKLLPHSWVMSIWMKSQKLNGTKGIRD